MGTITAFITQLVIEQSADAIFMITGDHRLWSGGGSARDAAKAKNLNLLLPIKSRLLHLPEEPEMKQRVANELAKINKARAARGEPRVFARKSDDVRAKPMSWDLVGKTPPWGRSWSYEHQS